MTPHDRHRPDSLSERDRLVTRPDEPLPTPQAPAGPGNPADPRPGPGSSPGDPVRPHPAGDLGRTV